FQAEGGIRAGHVTGVQTCALPICPQCLSCVAQWSSSHLRNMRTAIIFRERLLPPSETFIIEQARSLRRYNPVLAGLCRTKPSLGHTMQQVVLSKSHGQIGKAAAALYRKVPVAPRFLRELRAASPSIIHAHFATD